MFIDFMIMFSGIRDSEFHNPLIYESKKKKKKKIKQEDPKGLLFSVFIQTSLYKQKSLLTRCNMEDRMSSKKEIDVSLFFLKEENRETFLT